MTAFHEDPATAILENDVVYRWHDHDFTTESHGRPAARPPTPRRSSSTCASKSTSTARASSSASGTRSSPATSSDRGTGHDRYDAPMGKVIFGMSVSLDGFVDTPSHSLDWVHVDEELHGGSTTRRGRCAPRCTAAGCTS